MPAGIIITGGGSALNSIDIMARVALKLPSKIGTMGLTENNKSSFKEATWAVAYGLCIWGIHGDDSDTIETTMNSLFRRLWQRTSDWTKQFLP